MVKKLPRWQKEQKERRLSRRKLMVVQVLLLASFVLLIGLGVKFYGVLQKSTWDGQSQINLAVASQPVQLASYNPQEKSLVFLIFPPETYIETIQGYGLYKIESIYPLGELEGKGGELLAGSLQEYLGVAVDGYLTTNNLREIKDLLESKTNLSRWDLVRLWWQVKAVREDKIKIINLEQANSERLDSLVQQYFRDEKFRQEDLAIAVLNATDYSGLAGQAARLVKNLGGRLVGVGDIESSKFKVQSSKCEVRSQNKYKKSYTVKRLTKIFGCEWGGEDLANQRAEVVLILGE